MTGYQQTLRLASEVASDIARGRKRSMARIRHANRTWNHPLEWATLNRQIEWAHENLTPEALERQIEDLARATG